MTKLLNDLPAKVGSLLVAILIWWVVEKANEDERIKRALPDILTPGSGIMG